MKEKECKECGIQPVSHFNTDTKGRPKGGLCKVCNNKMRVARKAVLRGPVQKDIERDAILEKYKDDSIGKKKELDKLKAKRFRKRLQEKNKGKSPDPSIKSKNCIGDVCKGKTIPIEKFSKDSTKKDGYQVRCKDCAKFISNKNKEENKDIDINVTFKICGSGKLGCGKNLSLNKYDMSDNGRYGRHNLCNECRKIQRQNTIYPIRKTGTKKCSLCNIIHNVSKFYVDKHNPPDGLHSSCISCHEITSKKSYSKFPNFIVQLVKNSRGNAKKKKLIHNITKEDVTNLYNNQKGLCALTKEKMTHTQLKQRTDSDEHILNPTNMSIDRINSSIGYIPSNIQLVCAAVNKIKHNMTQLELYELCHNIHLHKVEKQYDALTDTEPIEISDDVKATIQKKLTYTKGNSIRRKHKIQITDTDIKTLYLNQNGKCAISGLPLSCKSKINELSIDRINSQMNYTKGNIHLTSNIINIIKSDMDMDNFSKWIEKMTPNICLFSL